MSPAASPRHQPLSISAELEDMSNSFWKRKYPRHFTGPRIIQQNLLMPCDGSQWGPGIHGECRGSIAATGNHQRIQGQTFWHRRWTLGTLIRDGHFCDREILFGLGLTPGIFQRAPFNPLSNQQQLIIRKFWLLGGHLRFSQMRYDQIQLAERRIAVRPHHLARSTPLHGEPIIVEYQITFFIVRVVARTTFFPKDWQDVLLKSDLLFFGRSRFFLCNQQAASETRNQQREREETHDDQLH